MWMYDKKLQFPINIKKTDPRMAQLIISQYGGPNGELGAALRYLSQRFTMPTEVTKSILNDIGTEELGHLEMVGTICHQLLKDADVDELKSAGYMAYADHGKGVYPMTAAGAPFTAAMIQSMGDPLTDLMEDLAAEQKAKQTYENLINMSDDPDVINPLRFLREREVVHFQRFGEALRQIQDKLAEKRYYFDTTM